MSVPFYTGEEGNPGDLSVEMLHGNDWIPFPMVPNSLITKQPQSPFSPAVQRGNAQKVIDQRLNVIVWDDFTGGLGELRADPAASTSNFYRGTLDTRNKGVVVLNPKNNFMVNLGRTFPEHTFVTPIKNGVAAKNLLVWSPRTTGATLRTSAGVTTQVLVGFNVYEVKQFRGAVYASIHNGTAYKIYKSADYGATWAIQAVSTMVSTKCLAVHDSKLFTFAFDDGKLYSSVDGTTWAAVTLSCWLDSQEDVKQLYEWVTPSGQGTTLYVVTNFHHYVLEEDAQEWHVFYEYEGLLESPNPRAHVWRRNSFVYMSFMDAADNNGIVLVHNGGTTDSVGPREKGYTPEAWFHYVSHLQGSVHHLYAFGVGGTVNGVGSTGCVMAMNELGGWHTVMTGDTMTNGASYVVGGGYDNQTVYAVMSNGDLFSCRDLDRRLTHPRADGTYYDSNLGYLESSFNDGGLKNIWKVGAYFLVDAQLADGSPGIPPGANITLSYKTDTMSTWVQLPILGATTSHPVGLLTDLSLDASSVAFPVVQLLPNGIQQQGVPFRRIQWRLTEQKAGSSGQSPAVVEISLYYTLWLEQFYSYSFQLDLTESSFRGFPNGTFQGYDREYLQKVIEEISQTKGYTQFRFSNGPWQQSISAVDMLLTHRVNANDGGSIVGVTVRDLRAPDVS